MRKVLLGDHKKELLDSKERIVQSIKYYEKRIACATAAFNTSFEEGYSSDSDNEFPTTIATCPPMPQLRTQQLEIRTCLHATQELTGLQVLESEVSVMVQDPVIEGEKPVEEPGLWREVSAECRIDLVPFSITFFVHQPNRKFSSPHYRGLKVLLVKNAHQTELATSVLSGVTRPADAIQVLKSYAAAYRSRRTTLARLADTYTNNLYMEPLAKGGYLLKCANLLKLSWRLENARSPVGAFQHEMKFDLEYMDQSYIKIIAQAHKQLADPTIGTDERTRLLAKMISTCLDAQGTKGLDESESDAESVNRLEKRRTTLDEDTEASVTKKRKGNTDDQIMAPPKSLPKKVKPKGKENMDGNRKTVKRSNVEESGSNVKKAKTDKIATNDVRQGENDQVEPQDEVEKEKNKPRHDNRNQKDDKIVDSVKNRAKVGASQENNEKETVKSGKDVKKCNTKQSSERRNTNPDSEKTSNVKKSNTKQNSSNKVANDGINTNTEKSSNLKEKVRIPNDVQLKTKKKVSKELGAQVASKDEIVASSKKDPLTTKPDSERDENIVSSKNDPKYKESESKTHPSKNKSIATSKNDLITSENQKKNTTVNAKNAEPLAQKDKPLKHDKPQTNKNGDKKKNSKAAEKDFKTAKKDIEKAKEDIENVRKCIENSLKLNTNIDSVVKKKPNADEEPNDQKGGKAVVIKENNIITAKNSDKAMSNKDKNIPKDSINSKSEDTIAKNYTNSNNNEENLETQPVKNLESQKSKQKSKATKNPEKGDKNSIKAKNGEEVTTDKTKKSMNSKNKEPKKKHTENNLNIKSTSNNEGETTEKKSEVKKFGFRNKETVKSKNSINRTNKVPEKKLTKYNSTSNNKGDTIQQVAKVKNVGIRNKEHIAERTDTNNFAINKPKISDKNQNKISIKKFSHNNPSAQNILSKKSNAGKPDKNNKKPDNTVKNLKASNIVEESGSVTKISKIPQKMLSPISKTALKKNPLIISPRKFPSTFKSSSDSNIKQKVLQKPITNIPRLLKKPGSKPKLY